MPADPAVGILEGIDMASDVDALLEPVNLDPSVAVVDQLWETLQELFATSRIDADLLDRVLEVQGLLADRGLHRLPIPDLAVAAAAEFAGLTVLHAATDVACIAEVTGQAHDWVVPRGTL